MDLALTERAGHATALATRAVAERRSPVISAGGDGVMSEVVNGLLTSGGAARGASTGGTLPALAIVSAGTGGDFGPRWASPRNARPTSTRSPPAASGSTTACSTSSSLRRGPS